MRKKTNSFKAKSYYLTKPQVISQEKIFLFCKHRCWHSWQNLTMLHNLFLFHSNYFAITGDCFQPESEIKLFVYWNLITIEMLSLAALLLGCDLSPPQIRGQFGWKKDCPFIYPFAEWFSNPQGRLSDWVSGFGIQQRASWDCRVHYRPAGLHIR